MKKIITTLAIFTSFGLFAQNNVGVGTLTPNANAKLEIKSDDKGVLITRLTTIARNTLGTNLTAVEDGMLVYDKNLTAFYYWDGPNLQWVVVGNGAGSDNQNIDNFSFDNTTNILTIEIEDGNIQTVDLTNLLNDGDSDPTNEIELPATATTGQVLSWDGANWVAQNASSGADNWGSDVVNTTGANISGDGTTGSPITVTDGDSDATNEIELPTGGTNGQVLTTDGSGVYTWVSDNGGTDDQNIANLAFDNTTNILTVGIENGTAQTIDLSSLVNDADNSITNEIQDLSINTTTNILTITNNGSATNIDLSSYLDNTDNQDLSLSGNTLSLTNDGTTVDLSGYMDNTDAQNIAGSSFTTSTGNLVVGISNGTNQTVNLNGLKDHDWYEVGTTRGADNINDNIFTQGNVGIGIAAPTAPLEIKSNNVFGLKIDNNANAVSSITYQNVIGFFDGLGNRMGYLGDGGPTDKVMQLVGNEDYAVKLQSVSAASDYRAEIYLNDNMDTSITFKTKNATRMFIEPNGNVGIGTTIPTSKLQIVDYYDTTMTLSPFTVGKLPGISVYNTTDFVGLTTVDKDNNQGTTNDMDGMLYWGDDGGTEDLRFTYMRYNGITGIIDIEDKMIIKGTGNVGIGTTSPGAKLHVKGDVGVYPYKAAIFEVNSTSPTFKDQISIVGNMNSTTEPYGISFLGDGHHRAGLYALNIGGISNSTGEFHLWARGAGNVISNNDFSVGLVNPANTGTLPNYGNRLYFSGGPSPAGYNSGNSDPLWMARYNTASDKSEVRMNVGDNNQVDDAFSIGYTNGGYNERFRFDLTGVARKPGGGTWAATSDKRTKKDIVNFSDGLNVLTKINPVTFKYNGLYNTVDDEKDYVGIIAQEVKPIAPYMIGSYEAPKTVESKEKEEILNYDGGTYMLYVLVNSVKEQQEQIEELKNENKNILEKLDLLLNKK